MLPSPPVLSSVQQRVYTYIVTYTRTHPRQSPSMKEIRQHCGLAYSSISYQLSRLEKRGFVTHEPARHRRLSLWSTANERIVRDGRATLLGGGHFDLVEQEHLCTIDMPRTDGSMVMVRVHDDVFRSDHVRTGDVLLLDLLPGYSNGDVVIAQGATGDVLLKRLRYNAQEKIVLTPLDRALDAEPLSRRAVEYEWSVLAIVLAMLRPLE